MLSFLYSGNWPSYLTDLLSLRLVGAVGTRNYALILTVGIQHDYDLNSGSFKLEPSTLADSAVCLCINQQNRWFDGLRGLRVYRPTGAKTRVL